VALVRSLTEHQFLIGKLVKREVAGRYRGSVFGLAWSMLNPLLMLAVYTFVFGVVFKAKWGVGGDTSLGFALNLFTGLIVHAMFAECANRAPGLVVSNVQYVKKVVFPLETMAWVTLGSSFFHWFVSYLILLCFVLVEQAQVPITILYVPMVLIPYMLFLAGVVWVVATIGVFFRDIGQIIGVIVTVMLFMSPVFYPVSALPEKFQVLIYLNPLTVVIEQLRVVTLQGQAPQWELLGAYLLFGLASAWFGFAWFQKSRRGFADAL